MRRMFQDGDGKMKVLERRGPGRSVKWREDLPMTTSTVWYDPESKKNYSLPDDMWTVIPIHYVDLDEDGTAFEKA